MTENLVTHTGMVHAPGRRFKEFGGGIAPKCCASVSAVTRMHFLAPTDAAVTCKKCIAALAKEAAAAAVASKLEPEPEPIEDKPAELPVETEPALIPENWLYMAKHANTESARAWWRKKCGISEES